MKINYLNCFTCNARIPSSWHTGTLCLLVETDQGLVLIDTGPGSKDYNKPPGILNLFKIITVVPLDPEETAIKQITHLGYEPEDVRNIVLTHTHFDHCGGLMDFPWATVHLHKKEYDAFMGRRRHWTELAYVRSHFAHLPNTITYGDHEGNWLGFPAIQLPFSPEMWLVPLFGHTRGHCGVAYQNGERWLFHVGDAGPVALQEYAPRWLVRTVLGPHVDALRTFASANPQVRITTGHMWLDFFASDQHGFASSSS